jgi:hypothetical protein
MLSSTMGVNVCACPAIATRASSAVMIVFLLHKMLTLGHLQTSLHGSLLIAFFIVLFVYICPYYYYIRSRGNMASEGVKLS